MHTKQKGIIGELTVAKFLAKKEIAVFTELGDLSAVDLIALIDNIPIKIQVKAASHVSGGLRLRSRSTGPSYSYEYTASEVDLFALVDLETEKIAWITSQELIERKSMTFRVKLAKNNQVQNTRLVEDYAFDKLCFVGVNGNISGS